MTRLVTVYRTNLIYRQIALPSGVFQSAVDRIVDHLAPLLTFATGPSVAAPRPGAVQTQTEDQLTAIYYVIRSKYLIDIEVTGPGAGAGRASPANQGSAPR